MKYDNQGLRGRSMPERIEFLSEGDVEVPATKRKGPFAGGDAAEGRDIAIEEQVYLQIRNALMNGQFAPGERLSIRKVAAALHTSPMPARSALRHLATERALDVLPSGTMVVPRLTRKSFAELTAMRLELEPLAVRLAAPAIDSKLIAQLERINAQHIQASSGGDPDGSLRADREFLFTLYGASDAPMLVGFIETMWMRRSPLFWEAKWALLGNGKRTRVRHDEMLVALTEGRVEDAAKALRREIRDGAEFLSGEAQFAGETAAGVGLASLSPARPRTQKK